MFPIEDAIGFAWRRGLDALEPGLPRSKLGPHKREPLLLRRVLHLRLRIDRASHEIVPARLAIMVTPHAIPVVSPLEVADNEREDPRKGRHAK